MFRIIHQNMEKILRRAYWRLFSPVSKEIAKWALIAKCQVYFHIMVYCTNIGKIVHCAAKFSIWSWGTYSTKRGSAKCFCPHIKSMVAAAVRRRGVKLFSTPRADWDEYGSILEKSKPTLSPRLDRYFHAKRKSRIIINHHHIQPLSSGSGRAMSGRSVGRPAGQLAASLPP